MPEEISWEPEYSEPQEGDYVFRASGPLGCRTTVVVVGEGFVGEYASEDEAIETLKTEMQAAPWYPNLWRESDHGNYVCITFER